jgi:hypothetical protein
MRRKLIQDLDRVVEHQRVAVSAPPVPHHPVGQDDEIVGFLACVDDDLPELVVVDSAGCLRRATLTSNIPRLVLYEGWPSPNPELLALPAGVQARLDALLSEGRREAALP